MSTAEKLAQVQALTLRARFMLEDDLRRRHPDAPGWKFRLRFAARWHGPEFTRKHFAWDPDMEGY